MKKLSFILAIVVALGLMAGCGGNGGSGADSSPAATPSEAAPPAGSSAEAPADSSAEEPSGSWFDGKTKLVMGTEASFPPYEYYNDNNEVVGVDIDIAQAIADHLGLELEVIDMKFDTITLEVDAGRIDFGAAGMSIDADRAKVVDFSNPYATSKQIIVVKEGSEIAVPDDLNGKTVGVQLGTVADLELEEWPDVTVAQYDKYFEAVSDLTNGRIDAIVMDILPAQAYVAQQEGLVILEEELLTDEYAICVQKGNQELLDAINTVLAELAASGKIDELTMNHLAG